MEVGRVAAGGRQEGDVTSVRGPSPEVIPVHFRSSVLLQTPEGEVKVSLAPSYSPS